MAHFITLAVGAVVSVVLVAGGVTAATQTPEPLKTKDLYSYAK